ncbi:MAG TPA: hypothetical protein VN493_19360 [Thermoanaerobaculia bacterium]|nr:hypothetical protein [Thermoanaerobaculia bacterium]
MIVTKQTPSRPVQARSASSSQSDRKLLVAAEQVAPVPEQLNDPPGTQTQAATMGSGTFPRSAGAQNPPALSHGSIAAPVSSAWTAWAANAASKHNISTSESLFFGIILSSPFV